MADMTPERLDEIRRLATHWTTPMSCRIAFAELIAALESARAEVERLLNQTPNPAACGGGE